MTIVLMKAICTALWGPQYRSEAARKLGIHLRTFMRYDGGERTLPPRHAKRLNQLLVNRLIEIVALLKEIENVKYK